MSFLTIYSLAHPQTGEVRYVGITKKDIKLRLIGHIYESKKGGTTRKCNWIKSLLNNGLRPIIEAIDIVHESEWEYWEIYWIEQFRQWNFRLTNHHHGGLGLNLKLRGRKHSEETKQLIRYKVSGERNYNYGKTLTDEWKKKISDSVKGEKSPHYGKKQSEERRAKKSSPIIQYTEAGDFVKEWQSMTAATEETGIKDISLACSGKINTAGGFQWMKKVVGYPMKISASKPHKKKVAQIDPSTNQVIKIWNSAREAQRTLRLNHISKVCLGYKSHKTIGGYKWSFIDHMS